MKIQYIFGVKMDHQILFILKVTFRIKTHKVMNPQTQY